MYRFLKSVLRPAIVLVAICVAAPAQENFMPDAATPSQEKPEEVKYSLILPKQKTTEQVKQGERSPFAKFDQGSQNGTGDGTTEENEIRDRLARLRVVGVSPGETGLRVMLGDMVLEPGKAVPKVLPEQTIALRVSSISPRAIDLVWVEKKPTGLPPRTFTIPVDLRPSVRSILKGQANTVNRWEKEKNELNRGVVAAEFPEVVQKVVKDPTKLVRDSQSRAESQEAPPTSTPPSDQLPIEAEKQSASDTLLTPPLPQLEEAMSFLKKMVPLGGSTEKK